MRKFSKKQELPLYLSALVFIVVLVLWFFPRALKLIDEKDSITQFRSDLKDVASLFYYVATLWLVLVTRKMSQVSLNALKASNRPEIHCELFIADKKPSKEDFIGINYLEIRNTGDSHYIEGQSGASIYLIIRNSNRGGKAINLKLEANLEAKNPDSMSFRRTVEISSLAEGDCVVVYLHRFETPSRSSSMLNLLECSLQYTTPFNEASKDDPIEIKYGRQNQMLAHGNLIGAINLGNGIGTEN